MGPQTLSTIDDAIDIAEAPAVPGLRFRHWRGLDDIPGMAAVADASRLDAGSADVGSVEDMLANYRNLTRCEPSRDIWLAEVDGTTVAYQRAWWGDRNDGTRAFEAIAFVHPAWADRGIEEVLLELGERRQEELAASMRGSLGGRRESLMRFAEGARPHDVTRLERAGYQLARRWAEMRRPDLHDIPALAVPAGIVLTRLDPDAAADTAVLRSWWDVGSEVFADHYGETPPSEEDWRGFLESPKMQPALWCLAVDAGSGEPAGHILNFLGTPGPDGSVVGWTESIAVRAPYRRRGLASAMLAESLRIVRDAGATQAALGVDEQNPNQAMTLYERLGFRAVVEELEYHRPIDRGEVPS